MNPTSILQAVIILLGEYRNIRASITAKGDPMGAAGQLLSDAELIDLLGSEAKAATAKIDALIAKHGG